MEAPIEEALSPAAGFFRKMLTRSEMVQGAIRVELAVGLTGQGVATVL